jgi:Uri superfamily endonuclease
MKGVYFLVVFLEEDKRIKIGKLGIKEFKKGYYTYVGSALNSLEGRIKRHLRKEKKLRWHIDYLLKNAMLSYILCLETHHKLECKISKALSKKFQGIKGFGSSDCSCNTHLFYSSENPVLK